MDGCDVVSRLIGVLANVVLPVTRKSSSGVVNCCEAVRASIPYPNEILQKPAEPIMTCRGDLVISPGSRNLARTYPSITTWAETLLPVSSSPASTASSRGRMLMLDRPRRCRMWIVSLYTTSLANEGAELGSSPGLSFRYTDSRIGIVGLLCIGVWHVSLLHQKF